MCFLAESRLIAAVWFLLRRNIGLYRRIFTWSECTALSLNARSTEWQLWIFVPWISLGRNRFRARKETKNEAKTTNNSYTYCFLWKPSRNKFKPVLWWIAHITCDDTNLRLYRCLFYWWNWDFIEDTYFRSVSSVSEKLSQSPHVCALV